MAEPNPASAGRASLIKSREKRSAPDVAESPEPKKSRFPWPFGSSKSLGKEKSTPTDLVITPTIALPKKSIQDSAEWKNMRIPDRIDAIIAENREKEAERKLRCPARKQRLDLQFDIKPDDLEWQKWHEIFQGELSGGTVQGVLEKNFEEGQKLAILPPSTQGIILDIQKEHTDEYKALLKGQLKGQKNNAITKFTMLHFGLPVEPLSLNNIINAGKDEDDEDDAPEDLPRVQRITFAEKPLEFLDLYHERSYGFPILRRPKPRVTLAEEVAIDPTQPDPSKNTTDLLWPTPLKPIFPINTDVNMRGGVGDPVFVYGLNGVGVQIQDEKEDSANAFLDAALKILGISKAVTTTWGFVVDQYRNQEDHKQDLGKQHVKSFPVDQSDFPRIYDRYLKLRLYNKQRDWALVVRRTTDAMTQTFTIPKKLKRPSASAKPGATLTPPTIEPPASNEPPPILSPRKTAQSPKKPVERSPKKTAPTGQQSGSVDYPALSGDQPPLSGGGKHPTLPIGSPSHGLSRNLPPTPPVTPAPGQRVVYSLDGKRSQLFINNYQSFLDAACRITDQQPGKVTVRISVTLYSNDPAKKGPSEQAVYIKTIRLPNSAGNNIYTRYIADVMFKKGSPDYYKNWFVVAHIPLPRVSKIWPDRSASELVEVADYVEPPSSVGPPSPPKAQSPPRVQKESSAAAPPTRYCHIRGYAGEVYAESTAAGFAQAGLRLLHFDPDSAWNFYIWIHTLDGGQTIKVGSHNFGEIFQRQIGPLIPSAGDWQIFVSMSSLQGPIELQNNKRNVVRITNFQESRETAYWKIPNDTETDYGINQLQDDFFRAMSVLFRPLNRPQCKVQIGPAPFVDIGFGGMEVTSELWERLRSDLKRQKSVGLEYHVKLVQPWGQQKLPNPSELIGIRMAGSLEYASAQQEDYVKIQKEIVKLARYLKDGQHPAHFRLWNTATAREQNGNSVLIPYIPASESTQRIKEFLEGEPEGTNCIWFRPEWSVITIRGESHPPTDFPWETHESPTLDAFRSALQNVFRENNQNEIKRVEIVDADGQHRFILSEDTTDDQWRKHIYDWFSGPEIRVQQNKKIIYRVEKIPPWGVLEQAEASTQAAKPRLQRPNQPPTTSRPPTATRSPPSYQPLMPSHLPNLPRIPRERIKLAQVVRHIAPKWPVYRENQNRLDRLQRDTYIRDQSVIQPGRNLADPLYGDWRELALGGGSSLPLLHFRGITLTDHDRKADEVEIFRNSALERMTKCPICDATFPMYEPQQMEEHLKAHRHAQLSAGNCQLCSSSSWAIWDQEQKKTHLWNHQIQDEKFLIDHFWQGFQCPVCDESLDPLKTDEILYHMAEHTPGLLKFCDRCSLDLSSCLPTERDHHNEVCIETKSDSNETRIYCDQCGKDRTGETDEEGREHKKFCIRNGHFCITCGIDLSIFRDRNELTQHLRRHKAPRGPRKKFCKRCGLNLNTMGDVTRASHRQQCYLKEPHTTERERIEELERRIAESRALKAWIDAESKRLIMRKNELDNREDDFKCREDIIGGIDDRIRKAYVPTGSSKFNCPLLLPNGAICNHQITITGGGGQIAAHYQHHCQPHKVQSAAERELIRRLPEFQVSSERLRAAVEKARADIARERQNQDAGAGNVIGEETETTLKGDAQATSQPPSAPRGRKTKSPTKPAPTTKKASPAKKKAATKADEDFQPATGGSDTENISESTGFAPRSRKRKAASTAPPRKVIARTMTGSKRKKAAIDDDEDSRENTGFPLPKSPAKRQRVKEQSFGLASGAGDESVERPIVVRRTTRATSGTPGPSMGLAAPVVRKIGRPKAKPEGYGLEEGNEEDAEIVRSPAKRGLQSLAKKGAK